MSNGNDDGWGGGNGGSDWGEQPQPGQGQGQQPGQDAWGQPEAPPPQPGTPQQPGPPRPQHEAEPSWQQPGQQSGAPGVQGGPDDAWGEPEQQWEKAPQNDMVHQGPGPGSGKLENNDIIALIASFLLPGVGHLMLGQTTRGLVILAGILFTCGAGYIVSLLVVADCYFVAMTQKYREVGDWEFFPDYNEHI